MNVLSNLPGTWKGDGSVEQAGLSMEGSTLRLASAKAGLPLNVIYETNDTISTSLSDYYFEITLEEMEERNGSLAVGVVAAPEEFKAGWDVRGMFYKNGSLNNGHETLKQGFYSGPPGQQQQPFQQKCHLKVQDVIGVRYTYKEPHTTVIFYLNGMCLGTGFRLYKVHKAFMPCLHVDGKMLLSFSFRESVPASITRPVMPVARYEGHYKLMEAYAGATMHAVPFPKDHKDIVLHIHKDTELATNNKFVIAIHVGNTFWTKMLILEESDATGAKIQVAKAGNTKMAVTTQFVAVEAFLASSLEKIRHMELREKTGKFVWNGPECRMIWHVHDDTNKHCVSY
jgi:hypothetical protein